MMAKLLCLGFFGVICVLTGQSYSLQQNLLIYADCFSKEFHLYNTAGTKLAAKSSSFKTCPESIAYAETGFKRLYWIEDTRPPSIGYLNIKNDNFEADAHHVDLPAGTKYQSIQVDSLSGLVYFVANKSIVVKSLDKNMGIRLNIPDGAKPALIAIDPFNKYLFWYDNDNRELFKANMDGSDATQVLRNFPVNSVRAMTVDIPEKKIYMSINDRMLSVPYNGRGKAPVVSSGDSSSKFLSIALDANRVFYTVENNPLILYTNKTSDTHSYGSLFSIRRNSDVVKSLVTSYTDPNKSFNDCNVLNGNCTGLCVTKGKTDKTCLTGISTDADVRLAPSGRIQVKVEGQWHNACADDFTIDEAIVACRKLRHYGPVDVLPPQSMARNMLKPMKCPYSATSLSTCIVAPPGATCKTGSAAVNCQVEQGISKNTHKILGGGKRASEGRLEVYRQGSWTTVCDSGHFFNRDAATALCHDLGYQWGDVSSDKFTKTNTVNSWRQDIKCFLGATTLDSCHTSPWEQVTCHPDEIIAVDCFPSSPEITTLSPTTMSSTTQELSASDADERTTTLEPILIQTEPDLGGRGTVRLPEDKQINLGDQSSTDFPLQTSTESSKHLRIGPVWLVAVIASVGTIVLIILTVSLSVFCYRKSKRQDEPFGIHSNPLVQQMSMMEQNELMLKYLEEKHQLGCLSDSKSSLNYNSAGLIVPGSLERNACKANGMNTTVQQGNHYETLPRAGSQDENVANERAYALRKGAQQTPIWKSPLPNLPNEQQKKLYLAEDVYLEPVSANITNNTDDHYTSMYQSNQDVPQKALSKDEENYDLPKMAKRKMSVDPRNPVL